MCDCSCGESEIKVTEIRVRINDGEFHLNVEDARRLWKELDDLFNGENIVFVNGCDFLF